jgi:hypothetical protein
VSVTPFRRRGRAGRARARTRLRADVLRIERVAAAFEPREVEQIADDVLDAAGLVADDREIPFARLDPARRRAVKASRDNRACR